MNDKCFCHLNGYKVKDADARREIEELKTKIESQNTTIKEQNTKFAEYDKKFDDQNKEIESLNETLEGMSTKIANIEKHLTTVDTRLAQLEEKTETKYYTFSYYDNAGVLLDQVVYEEGTNVTIPTASEVGYTVPTGHTFQEWIDSNGESYAVGSSVVVESDMTFTAVILADTVWVDYKYNDVLVSGEPYLYGDVITVCTPDKIGKNENVSITIPDGYEFKGWTCSDGKTYYGGETITLTDNIVFTGVVLAEFTVPGFGYNGVSTTDTYTTKPNETFTDKSAVGTLWRVDEDGYVYLSGYYTVGGDITNHYYTIYLAYSDNTRVMGADEIIPNYNYVAYRDVFTVTYISEGETIHTETVNNGDTHNILTNTSIDIPDGKVWSNWSCSNGASYEGAYIEQITVTTDLTFTAVYVDIPTYTLKYVSEGTTIHTETVESGDTHNILTNTSVEIPDGMLWSHWSCSNGASYEGVYAESITVTTDLVFTAVYVDNPIYTVAYINDGKIIYSSSGYSGDTVSVKTPEQIGVDIDGFQHWTDANGQIYDPYDNATITFDDTNVTLTAYVVETYTLTFCNSDASTADTMELQKGVSVTLGALSGYGATIPAGCTHTGWSDADGNTYSIGASYTVAHDEWFTPIYTRNTYNVYYYANGQIAGSATVSHGSTHTVRSEPDSVDYPRPSSTPYFYGWRGSDGILYQPGDSVTITGSFSFSAEFTGDII